MRMAAEMTSQGRMGSQGSARGIPPGMPRASYSPSDFPWPLPRFSPALQRAALLGPPGSHLESRGSGQPSNRHYWQTKPTVTMLGGALTSVSLKPMERISP